MFDDFEVIYSYSTQDALDDGVLVDAAIHPDLRTVTLLHWDTDRVRIVITCGLLAVLQETASVAVEWERINRQFIQGNRRNPSDFTELTIKSGNSEVTVWVGCEPFGADDPTPKITFYLPSEH